MTKKEIIWREILHQGLSNRQSRFTQKELAEKFHLSTSTVFNALKVPRNLGVVEVTGRFFQLTNFEKLLNLWATLRKLSADIIYQTHADLDVLEVEKNMPPDVVFGAYTAFKKQFNEIPADYDKVYVYTNNVLEIEKRFPQAKGYVNLTVFKKDPFLRNYGLITTSSQTFVDLWNLPEWYAQDFWKNLAQKIDAILA